MMVCVFANGTARERVRVIYIFLQLITFSINLEFKRPIPGENNRKRRIFHWLRLGDPLLVLLPDCGWKQPVPGREASTTTV